MTRRCGKRQTWTALATVAVALMVVPGVRPGLAPAQVQRAEVIVREAYFGLHIHRAAPSALDVTLTAWPRERFGSLRLWDARVAWASLEPNEGQWDFSRLDRYVALAESAHVDVLLPLGLSPGWASARPKEPSAYSPGLASEPRDIGRWRDYVRTVTSRYRGRIRSYEIWNEPNLPVFFSGTVGNMLELSTEAYNLIKGIDSSATVVSPAPTGRGGLKWLDSYLERGGGKWADVIGYHFYVGQNETPEDMARLMRDVQTVLNKHGLKDLPLWNTETGWVISDSLRPPESWMKSHRSEPNGLSPRLASAYVARALILGATSGVQRFYWYSWDHYAMGLVEPDGATIKPAGRAYGAVREWLVGASMSNLSTTPNGIWSVEVRRGATDAGIIAWCPGGKGTMRLPLKWKAARRFDLLGKKRDLSAPELVKGIEVEQAPLLYERMDTEE